MHPSQNLVFGRIFTHSLDLQIINSGFGETLEFSGLAKPYFLPRLVPRIISACRHFPPERELGSETELRSEPRVTYAVPNPFSSALV
jgi:hypothetical protein